MPRVCDAISRARPGAVFSTHAPDDAIALARIAENGTSHAVIDGTLVEWLEESPLPTEEEIAPYMAQLAAEEEQAAGDGE